MLNKKIILPFAAFAMASFVACGDDSSSSSPAADNSNVPASVKTLEDAINLTCTPTVNMCAKVYVEEADVQDTVQCNGNVFAPMTLGKPVDGCGDDAPAADTPANPDADTPAAEEPAGENPGAGKEPADPGAGEETIDLGGGEEPAGPGAGEEPAAGGDVIYCVIPGVMGGCEALPAAMAGECETTLEGQLVDACPAE